MIIKKKGTKIFVVNLFADFIISKLKPTESSELRVIDCGQFFVLKGKTSSKEVLNMSDLTLEFKNKYKDLIEEKKLIHTIDLIEYDYKFQNNAQIKQNYFFSENCAYSQKQIDKWKNTNSSVDENLNEISENELTYSSEFPHGYSLNRGRLLYYYGKKIINSIPPTYPFRTLRLELSTERDFHDEVYFKVYDEKSECYDDYLESSIRDMFNFDLSEIENVISDTDLTVELFEPLNEIEYLKSPTKDFIII